MAVECVAFGVWRVADSVASAILRDSHNNNDLISELGNNCLTNQRFYFY